MKYIGDVDYGGKRMIWGKGVIANGTVYLSGVEGIDPSTGKCAPDIETQTKMVLGKVKSRLEEAGSDANHIAKYVAYIVGRENLDGYRSANQSWMEENHLQTPPTYASTLVLVAGLARPDMLIEVDVTASLSEQLRPVSRP
jgi:enamine deaminase RidA (YjgF/YER057c/UK114 family)